VLSDLPRQGARSQDCHFSRSSALFAAVPGEPVDQVKQIEIHGRQGAIPARIYSPQGAIATLVYFHGGGWVFLSMEACDPFCRQLANASRCRVISVDYRLAPEHMPMTPIFGPHTAIPASA